MLLRSLLRLSALAAPALSPPALSLQFTAHNAFAPLWFTAVHTTPVRVLYSTAHDAFSSLYFNYFRFFVLFRFHSVSFRIRLQ